MDPLWDFFLCWPVISRLFQFTVWVKTDSAIQVGWDWGRSRENDGEVFFHLCMVITLPHTWPKKGGAFFGKCLGACPFLVRPCGHQIPLLVLDLHALITCMHVFHQHYPIVRWNSTVNRSCLRGVVPFVLTSCLENENAIFIWELFFHRIIYGSRTLICQLKFHISKIKQKLTVYLM